MVPPMKPTEYPNKDAVNDAVRAERWRLCEDMLESCACSLELCVY